jgi:hypothetical protein
VCMHQCRQAEVRVVQRGRRSRAKALGSQLSVGELQLSVRLKLALHPISDSDADDGLLVGNGASPPGSRDRRIS